MNKITTVLLTLLFLTSCGYTPIYSSKNFDFKLENVINLKNDRLHNKVRKGLQNFSNQKSLKVISLKIDVKKEINILSKNSKGDPSRYEMVVNISLAVTFNENENISKTFQESFNYNINKNRFELSQYEREIEDLLIDKNIDRIIIYLTKV
tara:strand:+ start:4073 stop:4525 length:453 start_codon:yes stop_codon:yes gene_type:complete